MAGLDPAIQASRSVCLDARIKSAHDTFRRFRLSMPREIRQAFGAGASVTEASVVSRRKVKLS